MRKFQFHPCGNFNESYEDELTIFETDFGRLWLVIGLIILFGVIPFISSPYILYILNILGSVIKLKPGIEQRLITMSTSYAEEHALANGDVKFIIRYKPRTEFLLGTV